jgi:beta-lactamase class D
MRALRLLIPALIALCSAGIADAQMLYTHFKSRYGGLEIYDAQSKLSFRVNTPRLQERLPPCSTYLLPHFAIALGTGVVKDGAAKIAFDASLHPGSESWPTAWRRDQTVVSALKDSVQWYAQQVGAQMGGARITQNLKRLKYGNADTTGDPGSFWLSGNLRISSFEQIDFLRALRENRLGFNPRVVETLRPGLVLERAADWTILGKYGSCPLPDGTHLGWLVGWVERGPKVWYYALTVDGKSLADLAGVRLPIVKGAMQELGFLPATEPAPAATPSTAPATAPAAPEAEPVAG